MPRSSPSPASAGPPSGDDELVRACLAGDERAWDALIERYGGYIYAVAGRAYGFGEAAVAEVFQDVCIRLYLGLRTYSGRGEFRSWLRAVVLSACREFLRQAARHPEPQEEPESPVVLDEVEAALDLRSAVDDLGEPCRTTIQMHFFADLTQAEVARRLGSPEGTIAARISRCLRRLRDALQEPGPGAASRG